jgi:DMSO/TMAO reductase YedYZ molybdopterin-dependent catalytic subunit
MNDFSVPRRDFLAHGTAAFAGLALVSTAFSAKAFPVRAGEEVIPWADQPPPHAWPKIVPRQLDWEEFDSLITLNNKFFLVARYGFLEIDPQTWALNISGEVQNPMTLTLEQIKARPRQEVTFTVECSGNHGYPFMTGAIGTAKWAGTPLAPILEEAGIRDGGIEVVFYGADTGEEKIRDATVQIPFARSLSVADAMQPEMLLCYEMNGQPLPQVNGAPVRLIAPGWYGIANVKWLSRIEVLDRRYMGRFMARDYVTIREKEVAGKKLAVETSVGRARLKSAPGRVTRKDGQYRIVGAAWGGDVAKVEVKIDDGPWQEATIDRSEASSFAWKPWSLDWSSPSTGEHSITSRVTDAAGQVQPAKDDPVIANKLTYWESNGQVTRRIMVG